MSRNPSERKQEAGTTPVTSHTGCVSRNCNTGNRNTGNRVTSHTGCVSRNIYLLIITLLQYVTSHTGCVSRNEKVYAAQQAGNQSHLTRDV